MPPLSVIARSNMFEPLLDADPSFLGKWRAFEDEWRSAEELPLYLALSELARHLIEDLAAGRTQRFVAVFEVVEHWHTQGDAYVKEAATIGLIEDLQNGNLHHQTQPKDFRPWLGPKTLQGWKTVDAFWS